MSQSASTLAGCKYTGISSFPMESTSCVVFSFSRLLEDSPCTATEQKLEEDINDEDERNEETWSGNQNRKLWKSTCVQAALSVRLINWCPSLKLNFTFSPSSAIKNDFFSPPWHLHLKRWPFSSLLAGHGRIIFGLRLALFAKRKRVWNSLPLHLAVSGKVGSRLWR